MKLCVLLPVAIVLLYAAACPALAAVIAPPPDAAECRIISDPVQLITNGNAKVVDGVVRLTENGISQAGSVFASKPVDISRFDTTFSFRLYGSEEHADGITFCVQNDAKGALALGSMGGYLGYGFSEWWDAPGVLRSIAVEFDDYYNEAFADLPTDHVGIDTLGSIVSKTQVATPVPLVGDVVNARVVYDGATLSVYAWTGDNQPSVPFLRYGVHIPSVLGASTGYVGFTAATATFFQFTDVISWDFRGSRLLPVQGQGKAPVPIQKRLD